MIFWSPKIKFHSWYNLWHKTLILGYTYWATGHGQLDLPNRPMPILSFALTYVWTMIPHFHITHNLLWIMLFTFMLASYFLLMPKEGEEVGESLIEYILLTFQEWNSMLTADCTCLYSDMYLNCNLVTCLWLICLRGVYLFFCFFHHKRRGDC